MAKKCIIKKFTSSDIKKISNLTNENFHGEARKFIAKKLCSKTEKKFDKINKEHIKKGYLSSKLSKRRDKAEVELMSEMRTKLKTSEINKIVEAL